MRVAEKNKNRGNTGRKSISIDSDKDKNTRQEQGRYKARKDTRSGKHKTKTWSQKGRLRDKRETGEYLCTRSGDSVKE